MAKEANCYLCDTFTNCDEHHLIPQAKGGSKMPTVFLCPSCHSNLHNYYNAYIKGKPYEFGYKIREDRLNKMVALLVKANNEREDSPDIKFPIVMPRVLYNKIKEYKVDKGYKSINDTILRLIIKGIRNELEKQLPQR